MHLPSITGPKMNSSEFKQLVEMSRNMQSLVGRLESKGHHTSKDILDLRSHIVSQLYRLDYSLDAISRSLVVLHDQIGTIAANQEIMKNTVSALVLQKAVVQGMNSQEDLQKTPEMELVELPDSPMQTPVRSTSPDITCSETIGPSKDLSPVPMSPLYGTMEIQEWEKVEELMKNSQMLM